MEILCNRNEGYSWTLSDGLYFRGYFFVRGNTPEILQGRAACDYFRGADSFAGFKARLGAADGVYSVIDARNPQRVWAAVDNARSMPLYFSQDDTILSDSAEAVRKGLGPQKEKTDPWGMAGLCALGEIAYALRGSITIDSLFSRRMLLVPVN